MGQSSQKTAGLRRVKRGPKRSITLIGLCIFAVLNKKLLWGTSEHNFSFIRPKTKSQKPHFFARWCKRITPGLAKAVMQVRFPLVQPMAAQCGSCNDTTDSDAMSYFAFGAGSRRFESGRGRQQNSKRPRSSEDRAPNVLAQVFFGCFRFRSSIGSSGELLTQGLQVQALPGPPVQKLLHQTVKMMHALLLAG